MSNECERSRVDSEKRDQSVTISVCGKFPKQIRVYRVTTISIHLENNNRGSFKAVSIIRFLLQRVIPIRTNPSSV